MKTTRTDARWNEMATQENRIATLSVGAKNSVMLMAHGRNPEAHGMSPASLKEAHTAGLISWNRDYSGQGWTLSASGKDFAVAQGWY